MKFVFRKKIEEQNSIKFYKYARLLYIITLPQISQTKFPIPEYKTFLFHFSKV